MWSELNFISIPLLGNECLLAGIQIYKVQINGSLRLTLHPLICEVKSAPSSRLHTASPPSSAVVMGCARTNTEHTAFERREPRAAVVDLLLWQDMADQKLKSKKGGLEQRDLSLQISAGARHGAGVFAKMLSNAHFNPETEESTLWASKLRVKVNQSSWGLGAQRS